MRDRVGEIDRRQRVAFDEDVVCRYRRCRPAPFITTMREAVRARDEVAVGVGRQQRHVVDTSASVRLMPRMSRACALTTAQVAMPPISTSSAVTNWPSAPRSRLVDQLAGGVAACRSASDLIGAQEHLVRGMRRVGLVLVDEGRGGVGRARGCRRRCPGRRPGPGRLVARVSTMK